MSQFDCGGRLISLTMPLKSRRQPNPLLLVTNRLFNGFRRRDSLGERRAGLLQGLEIRRRLGKRPHLGGSTACRCAASCIESLRLLW